MSTQSTDSTESVRTLKDAARLLRERTDPASIETAMQLDRFAASIFVPTASREQDAETPSRDGVTGDSEATATLDDEIEAVLVRLKALQVPARWESSLDPLIFRAKGLCGTIAKERMRTQLDQMRLIRDLKRLVDLIESKVQA